MGLETITTKKPVCIQQEKSPFNRMLPEERPKDCGNCYECMPDEGENPKCPGFQWSLHYLNNGQHTFEDIAGVVFVD